MPFKKRAKKHLGPTGVKVVRKGYFYGWIFLIALVGASVLIAWTALSDGFYVGQKKFGEDRLSFWWLFFFSVIFLLGRFAYKYVTVRQYAADMEEELDRYSRSMGTNKEQEDNTGWRASWKRRKVKNGGVRTRKDHKDWNHSPRTATVQEELIKERTILEQDLDELATLRETVARMEGMIMALTGKPLSSQIGEESKSSTIGYPGTVDTNDIT